MSEQYPNTQSHLANDSFLRKLEAGAADSVWATPVEAVAEGYIHSGQLGDTLSFMKRTRLNIADYLQNTALDGLVEGVAADGFDDSTSNRKPRTRDMYVQPDRTGETEVPIGFEIAAEQQPVMALAVLDPSKVDLPDIEKQELLVELKQLRGSAMQTGAVPRMSEGLRSILSSALVANNLYIESYGDDGQPLSWPLPFDYIASLKALYVLLSGEQNSGGFRQGAVRVSDEGGQQLIVGASGLNSAIDEMVARNFAQCILDEK